MNHVESGELFFATRETMDKHPDCFSVMTDTRSVTYKALVGYNVGVLSVEFGPDQYYREEKGEICYYPRKIDGKKTSAYCRVDFKVWKPKDIDKNIAKFRKDIKPDDEMLASVISNFVLGFVEIEKKLLVEVIDGFCQLTPDFPDGIHPAYALEAINSGLFVKPDDGFPNLGEILRRQQNCSSS